MIRHITLLLKGCFWASFFVSCQQAPTAPPVEKAVAEKPKMYEASELALLMRTLYTQNLEIKAQLEAGQLPDSFPRDFLKVHTAVATKNMIDQRATFDALSTSFVAQMHALKKAESVDEAKVLFNNTIGTCVSCHQVYCHGPLQKIKKLKLPQHEAASNPN